MKNIIVANWKMNPSTSKEASDIFNAVKMGVEGFNNVKVVVCPPFVYLPLLKGLSLGAQNVSYEEKGSYTGEVSPLQLRDLGVEYVILGHSESRKHFNDTDEIVNKKVKESLHEGLRPFFCLGEKEGENREQLLENQIKIGLSGVSAEDFKNIIIAYEPVWAIGTGKNCPVGELQNAVLFIKKIISDLFRQEVSENLTIIYGGSVNSQNSREYLKEGGVNGLLVGGASLKSEEFIKIVESSK